MTIREAQAIARENGYTLRKRDGEYRVNRTGGEEATANYTDCLDDAVSTLLFEVKREAERYEEKLAERTTEQLARERGVSTERVTELKAGTLTVREQSNYGRTVYYPVGPLAELFARVAGTSTLTDQTLSLVENFGYTVEVERPTTKTWR